MAKKITEKEIEKIIISQQRDKSSKYPRYINCGENLFLIIRASGEMRFAVRVKAEGKDTRVSIGNYPNISIAKAKVLAQKTITDQKVSNLAHKEEPNCETLGKFLENEYFPHKFTQFKSSSNRASNIKSIYRHTIIPCGLAKIPLDQISVLKVSQLLKDFEQTAGNKHNAVSIISMSLQYAIMLGYIPLNPISDLLKGSESPFKKPLAIGFKTIPPSQIFEKYFAPLATTPIVNRQFYLLIALTGFRFGECRLLQWSWCDFSKEIICIPSDAMGANKTQTDYYKPMTKQVKQLLLKIKSFQTGNTDFVFSSTVNKGAICEGSFREPFKALTSRELDFHGIRKVMRTWFSSMSIPVHISELALQHDVRSSLERVYDKYKYTEEIREALQKWNDFIEENLPKEFKEVFCDNFDKEKSN